MKRTIILLLTLFVFTTVGVAFAENPVDKVAPKKQDMQMYHIAMVKNGPNWKSQNSEEGMDIRMEVIEGIKEAAKSGLILSAGLVNDETDVEFILILDVETKTEAYNILQKAKNVANGFFSVDIYSYFAPKGLAFQK
ncbi:MAG: hypothetical protein KAH56_09980 [Candidatus Krumholzibacteria bacterium]|nr:hypothetical protein [Candidatus Krumholzibacteria bacterium]